MARDRRASLLGGQTERRRPDPGGPTSEGREPLELPAGGASLMVNIGWRDGDAFLRKSWERRKVKPGGNWKVTGRAHVFPSALAKVNPAGAAAGSDRLGWAIPVLGRSCWNTGHYGLHLFCWMDSAPPLFDQTCVSQFYL